MSVVDEIYKCWLGGKREGSKIGNDEEGAAGSLLYLAGNSQ